MAGGSTQQRRSSGVAAVCALALLALMPTAQAQAAKTVPFSKQMCAIGVAITVHKDGTSQIDYEGSVGVRGGSSETVPCKPTDVVLVGSDVGMTFTASLIAALVTANRMAWNETIGSILESSMTTVEGIDPSNANRTLAELVDNTSGMLGFYAPAFGSTISPWISSSVRGFPDKELYANLTQNATMPEERTAVRRAYAEALLRQKPERTGLSIEILGLQGTTNWEASMGVAQWLAEIATGEDLETLLVGYIFGPLNLTAGFSPDALKTGFSSLSNNVTALPPLACKDDINEKLETFSVMEPAPYSWQAASPYYVGLGGIWMSVADLAAWTAWHLKGRLGLLVKEDFPIISEADFEYLYRNGSYVWNVFNQPFRGFNRKGLGATGYQSFAMGVTQLDTNGTYVALAAAVNGVLGPYSLPNDDPELQGECMPYLATFQNDMVTTLVHRYFPGANTTDTHVFP